uniref:Uncharacterized protein n=1 Tax=Populus davidiana TaxID=266767 RepID=A0A6M2ERJ1_9ROSI
MQRSTVKPNLVIYTILVDSLCNCGKLKDGKELFYGHSDEGFQPNVCTYTGLIAALCEGLIIEAHGISRQMPAAHLTSAPIMSLSKDFSSTSIHQWQGNLLKLSIGNVLQMLPP